MTRIRYLSLEQVIRIHREMIQKFGGIEGVRDHKLLDSALNSPRQTFGGDDLYPTVIEKAAILGFGIVSNHPFLDGNKRTGQHVMEAFLELNGFVLESNVDEDERLILDIAGGIIDKNAVQDWLRRFARKRE
jgi:death-on-curing protein